jgi:hypothetical protein
VEVRAAGSELIWVEASALKLFESETQSAFQNLAVAASAVAALPPEVQIIGSRFVSEEIREAFLWSGILQSLPHAVQLLQSTQIEQVEEPVTANPVGRHLLSLFPHTLSEGVKPRVMAVIGGMVRGDKFRVLDELIGYVDDVCICGELCIPFLGLSPRIALKKHLALCAEHREVCASLLTKARLRGCRVILPVDLNYGDEPLPPSLRDKAYANIASDARNEGVDYEGEAKIVSLSPTVLTAGDGHFGSEVHEPVVVVDGHVFDIGTESCTLLKHAVGEADLLYVWGTVGACEVAGFQAGQTALVEAANQLLAHAGLAQVMQSPAQALPMAPATKDPLRTLLLGESTVEWFTRLVDSDGELGGDLISAGIVAYACRRPSLHGGLLGLHSSNVVLGGMYVRTRSLLVRRKSIILNLLKAGTAACSGSDPRPTMNGCTRSESSKKKRKKKMMNDPPLLPLFLNVKKVLYVFSFFFNSNFFF